ncbi:MAG: cytochrome c [Proteobacteria bacterium]|nr:cytochrome c [Pseudomonadota bacterium]
MTSWDTIKKCGAAKTAGRQAEYVMRVIAFLSVIALVLTWSASFADEFREGGNLFQNRGCSACHTAEQTGRKFAPPLNGISGKLKDERWLRAWLGGPRSIRPGTMMPDFRMPISAAQDISTFLLSLSDPHIYNEPDLSGGSVERGDHFFTYRGCRACHLTDHDNHVQPRRIPLLNDAGTKLRPAWVLLELNHPRAYNPDARIPLVDATPDEVIDIITYLDSLIINETYLPEPYRSGDQGNPESGHDHVRNYGCFACHSIEGFAQAKVSGGALNTFRVEGNKHGLWEALSPKITDTTDTRRMPFFNLSDDEVRALVTYMLMAQLTDTNHLLVSKSDKQQIENTGDTLLYDYGCRNCHVVQRGDTPIITTVIDRRHLIPPGLEYEGSKAQPQWLIDYLIKPFRMRIWMSMGMPYFYLTPSESESLVHFFRVRSDLEPVQNIAYCLPFDIGQISNESRELGRYRFQHDRCVQCHPAHLTRDMSAGVDVDDLAIDLMITKDRLRYEWVREFLRNPDRFAGTETRMPFIYFSPDGDPKVPDASQWLDRVARFLYIMDSLPAESSPSSHQRDNVDVNTFWENY